MTETDSYGVWTLLPGVPPPSKVISLQQDNGRYHKFSPRLNREKVSPRQKPRFADDQVTVLSSVRLALRA
jgi:hypothetical protein